MTRNRSSLCKACKTTVFFMLNMKICDVLVTHRRCRGCLSSLILRMAFVVFLVEVYGDCFGLFENSRWEDTLWPLLTVFLACIRSDSEVNEKSGWTLRHASGHTVEFLHIFFSVQRLWREMSLDHYARIFAYTKTFILRSVSRLFQQKRFSELSGEKEKW